MELTETSGRLVKGAALIREEWSKTQAGAAPDRLHALIRQWNKLMRAYYHDGGVGCALAPAGGQCDSPWSPVPLCWVCAGGQGMPPASEEVAAPAAATTAGAAVLVQGTTAQAAPPVQQPAPSAPTEAPVKQPKKTTKTAKTADQGAAAPAGGQSFLDTLVDAVPVGVAVPQAATPTAPKLVTVRMSAAGHCRRRVGYELLGETPTNQPPEHWSNAAALGDAGERIVVQRLRAEGRVLAHTVEEGQMSVWYTPPGLAGQAGLTFSGHPDGDIQMEGAWWNLEIKTPGHRRAEELIQHGVKVASPDYFIQSQLYMHAKSEPATFFVVLDRDTGRREAITVKYDQAAVAAIAERWLAAVPYLRAGQLPPPDSDGTGECIVCQYRSACPVGK